MCLFNGIVSVKSEAKMFRRKKKKKNLSRRVVDFRSVRFLCLWTLRKFIELKSSRELAKSTKTLS